MLAVVLKLPYSKLYSTDYFSSGFKGFCMCWESDCITILFVNVYNYNMFLQQEEVSLHYKVSFPWQLFYSRPHKIVIIKVVIIIYGYEYNTMFVKFNIIIWYIILLTLFYEKEEDYIGYVSSKFVSIIWGTWYGGVINKWSLPFHPKQTLFSRYYLYNNLTMRIYHFSIIIINR